MEKTILIGGEAGQGSAVTSRFIGEIFCALGYYVFNYRDYPSLIRGGHNFNVLRISDAPIFSHREKYDIIIAFDQKTIDKHQKNLKKDGFILGHKGLEADKFYPIDVQPILGELKVPAVFGNNVLIGWLFKHFGVNEKTLLKEVEDVFGKGKKIGLIKETIKRGYDLGEKKESLKKRKGKKYFISGSEGVGVGAINAGMDVYMAYPMTPATPVLHFLAGKQVEHNFLALQLENEIGVINSALGASFAGAKTMVGTSGGGFALMMEGMSLAGISEVPLVVYLAQRTGPGTGVPTYTTQGDLKFALNAGQGEFPRIVVAPGDAQEAITRTQEAFYLAYKFRNLAIVLADKHVSESDYTFQKLDTSSVNSKRYIVDNPSEDYKSYKITKDGISPRAVPGQGPVARATSYEHNEYGNTIEDAEWTVKMHDKRFKKEKYIRQEVEKLNPVSVYGKGKNLIVGWGSTKGAILDALPDLKDFKFMQISYLSPFPRKTVEKELKKAKRVVLVENNATGLLAEVIAEQTGHIIKEKVLKYDARPFVPDIIVNKIKGK